MNLRQIYTVIPMNAHWQSLGVMTRSVRQNENSLVPLGMESSKPTE